MNLFYSTTSTGEETVKKNVVIVNILLLELARLHVGARSKSSLPPSQLCPFKISRKDTEVAAERPKDGTPETEPRQTVERHRQNAGHWLAPTRVPAGAVAVHEGRVLVGATFVAVAVVAAATSWTAS